MNAGRAIRHLEEAGFSHQQATGLIEVVQSEVLSEVATKDFVELACERVKREIGDKITTQTRWFAGIAIIQTASIIFGTVGLIEILR
jgi:hypothetical protein